MDNEPVDPRTCCKSTKVHQTGTLLSNFLYLQVNQPFTPISLNEWILIFSITVFRWPPPFLITPKSVDFGRKDQAASFLKWPNSVTATSAMTTWCTLAQKPFVPKRFVAKGATIKRWIRFSEHHKPCELILFHYQTWIHSVQCVLESLEEL